MSAPTRTQIDRARTQRRIAATLLATFLVWMAAQFLGARMGLSVRAMGLVDLVALAVFGWALWMLVGLWRTRTE